MIMLELRRRALRRNRIFRDRIHPLDKFDDVEIRKKFRFNRETILRITDELDESIRHPNRLGALPPVLQVLLTLRFYACGTFQDVCAELINVSQPTACRTIDRVTKALAQHTHHWIHFPNNPREIQRQKDKFFDMNGFPGVVGCIDGTQIRIQAPSRNEHEYVKRKGYHSLNIQVSSPMLFDFIIVNT